MPLSAEQKKAKLIDSIKAMIARTDGSHAAVLAVWDVVLASHRAWRQDAPISDEMMVQSMIEAAGGTLTLPEVLHYVSDTTWSKD